MEKYDNIVKGSEIRKLVESKMYHKALTVLETVDLNKVKVLTDLSVYAEVYIQTGHYEKAKQLLLKIRQKSNSRRVIAQLIKVAIKSGNEKEAEQYYDEYIKVAPKDADKFILRYRIDLMKGADITVLIESLERLKEYDYVERWAYELAKLYHEAGMKDKCVRECNDIILWFGDGVIVEKAKMLRAVYVGEPKHVETISAEKRKEMETKQELLKTKDLTNVTKEVNDILNAEDSVNEQKTLENSENIQYNHKSVQDIPEIDNNPVDYEYIYHNEALLDIFKQDFKDETVKRKIAAYLDECRVQNHANSFAIEGSDSEGRQKLAKEVARAVHELGIYNSSRIAKINSNKLNQIDLEKSYSKLEDSLVVVEEAAALTTETMEKIQTMLDQMDGHVIVVLEDEVGRLEELFCENGTFATYFHGILECRTYSKEDLIELAMGRFSEAELELDDDASICLETACNQIAVNVVDKERVSSLNKMVDQVIERAEDRSVAAITSSKGIIDYDDNEINKIIASDF